MTSSPTSRRHSTLRHRLPRIVGLLALAGLQNASAGEDRPCTYGVFNYALIGDAAFSDTSTAALEGKETRFAAGFACFGAANRRFDVGLDYQYTRYLYDGIDSRNRDLHRAQFPLGLRAVSGAWRVDAYLAPGFAISSNVLKKFFERISSDDVFATAGVEAIYGARPEIGLIVGGKWDRAFGRQRIYPVIGIDYRPGPRVHARVALPDSSLSFAVTDRQALTLRLYPAGFEWHVLDDDLVTEFDYRVEAWRADASWSIEVLADLWADLSVGYEFSRRHEFDDRSGIRIEQDVDDAVVIAVGLRWREGPIAQTHRIPR
ncbi:MAG: DUF6268 family outer membrane beta-barrel protein [Gammaproteobacteria bacterium]